MEPIEVSSILEKMLRLYTHPVGIKMYEVKENLPEKPLDFKVNICQLVSMARYQGKVLVGVPEKMVCSLGAACTGLIKTPEILSTGKAALGTHAKDEKAAKKFMKNTFKIGDTTKEFDAILIEPLGKSRLEPDVVIIYGNPAQMTRIIHACSYGNGEKVRADTVGEASLCSAIGNVLANHQPIIGFPSSGDRIFGGTQDTELLFAAPYQYVKYYFIGNLKKSKRNGYSSYPIAPNEIWTPSMPKNYTIQPEDLMEEMLF